MDFDDALFARYIAGERSEQRCTRRFLLHVMAIVACAALSLVHTAKAQATRTGAERPNIVFILTDDHRYDFMGFHPNAPAFLETPNMDAIARDGVHFRNAFVTTSLCSPSRASILTGMYMHNHHIIDNYPPVGDVPPNFAGYLQDAGYETAFIGKWHMGGASDDPQPGFDYWVSFRGQGEYFPPKDRDWWLNVNGEHVPQKGYITDELTDYALNWLDKRDDKKPFFLYLSQKGIHDNFAPAPRHEGRYRNETFTPPENMADTPENYEGKPMWVKNQRNSWHGVDYPYHWHNGSDLETIYLRYAEALLSIDESVGRVLDWLHEEGLDENTLVIYMGDNGFQWGEHGLIDKRTAYEESMRVPLLARWPAKLPPGTPVDAMVANIDIAPTILDAAGVAIPEQMDGRSFLPLAAGQMNPDDWRQELLYEYYWENAFPQTPTTFALRTPEYKFIQYYGVWDTEELYDLQNDPHEDHNLIRDPEHQQVVRQMRNRLHAVMKETGVTAMPIRPKNGPGQNLRQADGSKAAEFPSYLLREGPAER